jgi:hypothetical protein
MAIFYFTFPSSYDGGLYLVMRAMMQLHDRHMCMIMTAGFFNLVYMDGLCYLDVFYAF